MKTPSTYSGLRFPIIVVMLVECLVIMLRLQSLERIWHYFGDLISNWYLYHLLRKFQVVF